MARGAEGAEEKAEEEVTRSTVGEVEPSRKH